MKIKKDDSMLIDIQYIKPNKKMGKIDYLYIIWKDLSTGEKHLQTIPEPMMEIYFEKPEFRNHIHNKSYEHIDHLNKVAVKYSNIINAIADDIGPAGKQKLYECYETKNYTGIKEFLIYPYVYGADYDIRTWYRQKWMEEFDNDKVKPITKGFLDIEVDIMEASGFPSPIENPIDLVTLIDNSTNISYTFSLVGVNPPVDANEEKLNMYHNRQETQNLYVNNPDLLIEEAHKLFDENYPDMEYKFFFYNDERKMLVHLFQLINSLKLDFIGVWNISFDIPYIMDRLVVLGLNPADVICHPDFIEKECWFKKDRINFDVKNKSDFFHVSSYTIFYDQMITYAAIRKGQSELRSNKLTYIAEREIGDEKLDYSEIGNIKTLSYNNYLMYVLYNIKDVLLQTGIEKRTSDLETYYLSSYKNITPYESEFKQTVKLRNVQYNSYLSQNLVPGENVNSFIYNTTDHSDDDDEPTFEGALVGNPLLIDNFGVELFGRKTNSIFDYSIDFDMSAFYPSVIRACNVHDSTLIFKMILDANQYDVRGGDIPYHGITDEQICKTNNDSFCNDIAKEVMDNFQTKNYLTFAHKWLNLPSVEEVFDELMKEYEYE